MKYSVTYLLSLCLISPISHGTLYQWTDPQGRVHYSDQPQEGAIEFSLSRPANIVSMPTVTPPSDRPTSGRPADYQFSILSPQDQATIRANNGQLTIELSLSPSLQPTQRIELSLNGQKVKTLTSIEAITLDGIDRGEHQLKAQLIDKSGKVLASAEPITLYMHRYSRLNSAKPSN